MARTIKTLRTLGADVSWSDTVAAAKRRAHLARMRRARVNAKRLP